MQRKNNVWNVYIINIDKLTKEFASENSKRHTGNGLVFRHNNVEIIEEKIKFLCDLIKQTKFEENRKGNYNAISDLLNMLIDDKVRCRITKKLYKEYIMPLVEELYKEYIIVYYS